MIDQSNLFRIFIGWTVFCPDENGFSPRDPNKPLKMPIFLNIVFSNPILTHSPDFWYFPCTPPQLFYSVSFQHISFIFWWLETNKLFHPHFLFLFQISYIFFPKIYSHMQREYLEFFFDLSMPSTIFCTISEQIDFSQYISSLEGFCLCTEWWRR